MSEALQLRSVFRRLAEIESRLETVGPTATGPIIPYQITSEGFAQFNRGVIVGGGGAPTHVYEPPSIPAASGLVLTPGASFDTIYINASWTHPTSLGADQIVQWIVQVTKAGASFSLETTVGSGESSVRLEPLEPNTQYTVQVFGVTRLGRNGVGLSGTVTTGKDSTVPAAPTFPGSPVTPAIGSLFIKWNANTERDVANGAGLYRVVVSTLSNLSSPVISQLVSGTSYVATGLTGGQTYYVGVYAIDSSGNTSPVASPSGGPWTPAALTTEDLALSIGGGNIVKDSGFESGVVATAWTPTAGVSIDATGGVGSFGTKALQINGTGDYYAYQDLTLQAGTWIISTWAKAQNVANAPGDTGSLGVVLQYSTRSGTAAAATVLMGGTSDGFGNVVAGKGSFDWRRLAFKITVTSPSAVIRVQLRRGFGGANTGFAWFDQVQAELGTSITAYAPRADELTPGSVTTAILADGSITTPKITAGAITAGTIAAGAIGTVALAANAVTAAKIAADTITANELAAGSVTTNELAANAVTAAKIVANTITAAQIQAGSIGTDRLAVALALTVGQRIQSANYVAGTTGWRINAAGDAELNAATIRGSTFVGGSINIADRIQASPADASVHLAANVEIGGFYSGTVYSGDTNWGFQVGTSGGNRWSHVMAYLDTPTTYVGFYDNWRQARALYVTGNLKDMWFPGPDGRFIAQKRNQSGGWATAGITVENGGVEPGSNGNDAAISLHAAEWSVASMMKVYGPLGGAIEFRDGADATFVPVKASAFLVNSASSAKSDIQALAPDNRILELEPVRFKRPVISNCSLCGGAGKIQESIEDPNAEHGEEGVPLLKKNAQCPVCKGAKGSPARSEATKAYEDTSFIGLVAEEVGEVIPEATSWDENGSANAIDYAAITALLIDKVKDLANRIEQLERP